MYPKEVVLFVLPRQMMEKRCLSYMKYVQDTNVDIPSLETMEVVKGFMDVLSIDLSGIPRNRDNNFPIEFEPSIDLISIIHIVWPNKVIEEAE